MPRRVTLTILLILAIVLGPFSKQGAHAQQPYPAPPLSGGAGWLNTSRPLDLRDLRGKIVLLDFWTYCCINCIHILPTLKKLEEKYPNQLVVIGVHSPKFNTERDIENLRRAVLRYDISHPVISDSSKAIWRRYKINFWPTMYLIDPEGKVCAWRRGEAPFDVIDKAIARQVRIHKQKGTLNEKPIRWDLELDKQPSTPLRFPGKIIVDATGQRVVIADSGHHRLIVTDMSGQKATVIGSGQAGRQDGSLSQASFHDPQGMVLNGDTLYVADNLNHMVRKVDLEAGQVTTIAGTGKMLTSYSTLRGRSSTPTRYALSNPWDLSLVNGRLYIAMAGTHQIAVLNLQSNSISPYAGNGVEDVRDGSLAKCCLAQPSGLATDGKFLFVVDSEGSSLRTVTLPPGNNVGTLVGTTGLPMFKSLFAFGDRDGQASAVRLQHPIGVTYAAGKIYIADTYNHKIKLVDPVSRNCVTLTGVGRRGTSLQPLQLHEPAGLAVAGQTLFIADTNNHRIVTVDLASQQARELTISGLQPPPRRPAAVQR
ncbi:MAG: thioredoxin-like domain-containing protein [Planctomycetota bacterium]|nr:thioredoxin-like domain-containing protein [Planctomycetota bacterium]